MLLSKTSCYLCSINSPISYKSIMIFKTNKSIIKGGEIIEISWDGQDCSDLQLIIETGNKKTLLNVPQSGSKKLRMKGGSLLNSISLKGTDRNGKKRSSKRTLFIWGKQKEFDDFEYVNDKSVKNKLSSIGQRIKLWWNMFTPEKKHLYIILVTLCIYHVFLNLYPLFASILMMGLIMWIGWMIIKK